MAVYLDIKKASEKDDSVTYSYSTVDGRSGEFTIDKASGEIQILRLADGDDDEHLFRRAAHKITKHCREGELPELTCWAS